MLRIAVVAISAVALAGGLLAAGWKLGRDNLQAEQASISSAILETADAIELRTAQRIADIRVTRQVVGGKVREIVRENTVYRDCLVDAATERLLNDARAGRTPE